MIFHIKEKQKMRQPQPILHFTAEQDALLRSALNTAAKNYLCSTNEHRYADTGMFVKLGLLSALCLLFYLWHFASNRHGYSLYVILYLLHLLYY